LEKTPRAPIKFHQNNTKSVMFKWSFIFLIMVLFAGIAFALPQKKTSKPNVIHHQLKTDTAKINVRNFNAAEIKKYRNDPAFKYAEEKTGITLWDRFWAWVWHLWESFWQWVARLLEKLFGSVAMGKHAASVMKYFILGLAALTIVYVIFKLIGINLLNIFKKNKTGIDVPYTESLENINEIDFDEAIENALAIKNYRLAVRLLYLRSLKQLNDKGLISWKLDKTNAAYLNELTDAEQRRKFSIVTRQFEYVWYGDFPVNGQSFQKISAVFQEFKQHLS
jgi:hypothetical protein